MSVEEFVKEVVRVLKEERPVVGAGLYEVTVDARDSRRRSAAKVDLTIEEEPTIEERVAESVKAVASRLGLVEEELPGLLRVRFRDGRTVKVTWRVRR